MIVGLHDADNTGFPNLALMKLSAWHKAQGDTVRWWTAMEPFDRVYSSKVFTFTPECLYLPENTVRGARDTALTPSCRRRLTPCSRITAFTRIATTQSGL